MNINLIRNQTFNSYSKQKTIQKNENCQNAEKNELIYFKSKKEKLLKSEITTFTNAIKIKNLLSTHFTQHGQEMIMKILKTNREKLKSNNEILTLFKKLLRNGKVAELEQECYWNRLEVFAIELLSKNGFTNEELEYESEYYYDKLSKIHAKLAAQMYPDDILLKKSKIVNIIKKYLPEDEDSIKVIQNAKTKEDMMLALDEIRILLHINTANRLNNKYCKLKPEKQIQSFSLQQEYYKFKMNYGECILEINKLINPISTDPEIVKIENLLKSKYKMEYVHFSTLSEAKAFLKSLNLFKNQGILPKAVLSTPFLFSAGGSNVSKANGNSIILANSELRELAEKMLYDELSNPYLSNYIQVKKELIKLREYSINHPLYKYVHELEHSNKTGYGHFEFPGLRINNYARNIAYKISSYAAMNNSPEEWRTDLRTKVILGGELTKDEKILLDYISSKII